MKITTMGSLDWAKAMAQGVLGLMVVAIGLMFWLYRRR